MGLIGVLTIYIFIDPKLPTHTDEVITEIIDKEIPELVDGETGYAKSGSVKIWYEIKNKSQNTKGTILLINGYIEPSTSWNQTFLKSMVDSGYQVIRFDHRDVGLSDWLENWDAAKPYSMEDMISDALAVLDHNRIEKVNIVGYSMGGYIGLRLANEYPSRVLSLTALSTTAYINDKGHPKLDRTPPALIKLFLRNQLLRNDRSFLKMHYKVWAVNNGSESYDMNLKLLGERVLYEIHKRRGFNLNAGERHWGAVKNSKSYYNELDKIKIPTLIVHGKKDPALSFELAEKYSSKIENSKTVWIDEAGHVITNDYVDHFHEEFFKMLAKSQQ